MNWHVGVAEVDVTPPIGVWLTGFAARHHPATAIHDPLTATALALRNQKGDVAVMIAVDLVGLTEKQVQRIRSLVKSWTGVNEHHLLINCSHTHSGPAVGELVAPWMGIPDENYLDVAVRKVASCVKTAVESLKPARLLFGRGQSSIGVNRRQKTADGSIVLGKDPQGAVDREVDIVMAEDRAGTPIVAAFAFACHPVVLGSDSYTISADYVGAARQFISKALGGAPILFLQGCAGNINPRDRGRWEVAQVLGEELGNDAVAALRKATKVRGDSVRGIAGAVSLRYSPPPPVKELRRHERENRRLFSRARADGRLTEVNWRGCEAHWARGLAQAIDRGTVPKGERINLQVLQVGDILFLASAAETFTEIGQTLRSQSPFKNTVPLGYSNGCIGYLPTAAAYQEGGYEVDTAFKYYGRLLMIDSKSESRVIQWLLNNAKGSC